MTPLSHFVKYSTSTTNCIQISGGNEQSVFIAGKADMIYDEAPVRSFYEFFNLTVLEGKSDLSSAQCVFPDVHTEAVQAALAKQKERKMAVPMPSKRRSLVVQTSVDAYTPPGREQDAPMMTSLCCVH